MSTDTGPLGLTNILKLKQSLNEANNKIKQLETTIKELQEVNEYLRDKIEKLEYRRLDK